MQKIREMEEQLKANAEFMKEYEKSFKDKLNDSKKQEKVKI